MVQSKEGKRRVSHGHTNIRYEPTSEVNLCFCLKYLYAVEKS